jgi:site-specific DNA-methyltransferase (adenine-specific)
MYRLAKDGASIYVFGAIYNYDKLLIEAKKFFEHKNTLCWLYPNGMSRLQNNWQIIYDPIFFGVKGENYYFNQDEARLPYTEGTKKRLRSPVMKGGREWKPNPLGRKVENVLVAPVLAGKMAQKERVDHPTQKPLKLIKQMILVSSKQGDVVLDPFLGSGTTAVAAQQLKRKYIGIEKEPKYVEIAQKRLEQQVLI